VTGVNLGRILVVDDVTANLRLLTDLLTAHGHTVHPASGGRLALEFVRSTLPDLILLDIRMPGMDGYEVCRRLKAEERTRAVPIILVSILEDQRAKVRGFHAGAVDYITKPFQPDEVLARVQLHLRLRELTERLEQKVDERTRELMSANHRLRQEIAERTQAEDALRQSEARYHGMVLALGEGIVVHDTEGRVVECNQEAERILGLRRGQLTGLTSFEPRWHALHEDGSPFPGQDHPAMVTLRTGRPCHGVVMRIRTDLRRDSWILVNSEPLRHPGEPTLYGAVVSFSDFTDVHRAHEEFRALADNSPDFIARYDRDGRQLYVNPALAQVYGLTADQLIGGEPGDHDGGGAALVPESATLLRQKLREVFERGPSAEVELTYRTPKGLRITHNRLVAEYDQDGRVRDVLVLGRDLTELMRVEQELAEREGRYRDVFDNALNLMGLLEVVDEGKHFRLLEVNPSWLRSTGFSREAVIGRLHEEYLLPDDAAALTATCRRCVEAGVPVEGDLEIDVVGGRRWYRSTWVPVHDGTGRVSRIIAISWDVTERLETERALADSEERFRLAFDDALVGMGLLSVDSEPHFRFLRVNRAMCEFLGQQEEELLGLRQADVLSPETVAETEAALEGLLSKDPTSYRAERSFRGPADETVWGLLSATLVRDVDGVPLYVLCQVEDITARKHAEQQLVHRALHDDLTGLPNRALLLEHLTTALARSKRTGSPLGVLFLDLDDFKAINDSFGHTIGDEFLSKVATRIRTSVRASDVAARVGGDEFVIICEDLKEPADAGVIAGQIQQALASEISVRGQTVTAQTSIGIALSNDDSTPETLLRDADSAMYAAKRHGGRRWEPADTSLHAAAIRALTVEAELRRAVERREFLLHYQPVIDLPTGRIVAVEALLRWQHPRRGLVLPEEFIDVAEHRGPITELGAWVLHTACAQASAWYRRFGDAAPCLAVNVSTRQLGGQGMTKHVDDALDVHALPADRLFLEITESQLLLVGTSAMTDLHLLTERGIHLAIDDFGTGCAGFDYLRRLPVNELKIDKSFIDGVTTDPTHTAIATSVVALGLSLGLTVVAEGVTTPQQLRALRGMGCSWGQGWLWHPALPADDLDTLLGRVAGEAGTATDYPAARAEA
jgi:diguanylate cyclase (GGDEF)-like protein/PAS domain S-box-containing protein